MMEYQTIVNVGKNSITINFTGGSVNNGCKRPARYMTKNLIIQNAIEACDEYKRGRIRLERTITLNEDIPIERPKPKTHNAEQPSPTASASAQSFATSGSLPQHSEEANGNETHAEPEAPTPKQTRTRESDTDGAEEPGNDSTGLMEVEVRCKDVAKQYLQDHFEERPAPLRTWDDVQACAAKYGIIFKSPTLG